MKLAPITRAKLNGSSIGTCSSDTGRVGISKPVNGSPTCGDTLPLESVPSSEGEVLHMEKLLTVRECAELLQVHRITVYRWVECGQLPCIRLGSRIRFRYSELVRWLGEREAP